ARRALARLMATHAIGDCEEPDVVANEVRVLVVIALLAYVGQRVRDDLHRWTRVPVLVYNLWVVRSNSEGGASGDAARVRGKAGRYVRRQGGGAGRHASRESARERRLCQPDGARRSGLEGRGQGQGRLEQDRQRVLAGAWHQP